MIGQPTFVSDKLPLISKILAHQIEHLGYTPKDDWYGEQFNILYEKSISQLKIQLIWIEAQQTNAVQNTSSG